MSTWALAGLAFGVWVLAIGVCLAVILVASRK